MLENIPGIKALVLIITSIIPILISFNRPKIIELVEMKKQPIYTNYS
jgi:hypothetical protein